MIAEDTIRLLEASLSPAVCGEVYQKRVEIDEYKANQLAKAAAFRPTDVNSPTYALDVVLYEQAVSSVAVSVANFESSLWQNNPHLFEVHIRLMEIDRLKAELGEAGPVRANFSIASPHPLHSMKSFSIARQPSLQHSLPMPSAPSSTHHSLLSSHQSLNFNTPTSEPRLPLEPASSATLASWPNSSLYVDNLRNRHFSQYLPNEDNRSELSGLSDATNWTMNSHNSGSTQMSIDGRTSPAPQLSRSQTLDAVPETVSEQDFGSSGGSSWLLSTVNTTTMDMLNDADKVMALYKSLDPQARQELTQLLHESLKLKAAQVPKTPTVPKLTEFTSTMDLSALSARVEALATHDKPAMPEKVDAMKMVVPPVPVATKQEALTQPAGPEAEKGHTLAKTDKSQGLERQSSSSLASDSSSRQSGGKPKPKKKGFGKKLLNGIVAIWEMGDNMWDEGSQRNVRG